MEISSQKYMPTYILIVLNVAIYVYTSVIGGNFVNTNIETLWNYGQVNAAVFAGEYWRLGTAMFVHASIIHLGGNMLFLLIFGLRAEEMFSLPEYIAVYILSGLAGNLLSLAFLGPFTPSVGASGAIFGMLGAVAIYARRTLGQSVVTALVFTFFLLLITVGPGVNVLAHLGGLAAGLLIGYVLGTRRRLQVRYSVTYSYPSVVPV